MATANKKQIKPDPVEINSEKDEQNTYEETGDENNIDDVSNKSEEN